MISCSTLRAAQQVPGLIHIQRVADNQWDAYVSGDALPNTMPSLAERRAQAWESIKAERDRRKLDGGYTAGGKWFHSDVFSRTQQIGLVLLAAGIPANLQWKTMDGSFVTMTQTLAGQVFAAAASHDIATFAAAEAHKAAMEAAADPLAYDFSGSWPSVYAG
jgi:hypothetical protein